MDFLFEKRSEPYIGYGEVSIGKEKIIIVQEACQSNWLCQLTGQDGVNVGNKKSLQWGWAPLKTYFRARTSRAQSTLQPTREASNTVSQIDIRASATRQSTAYSLK